MAWRAIVTRRATRRAGATFAAALAIACAAACATVAGAAERAPTAGAPAADAGCTAAWARWDAFKREFVSADGRVIDVGSADSRTVSEGQAYGLFFALVANDRRAFDTILTWTENNLAQGDLSAHLPAWLWGRAPDGAWRVLDTNAASDADLWIAYTLVEAGRLWHERSYTARGALLAKRVLDDETAVVPGLGVTLLPGPVGFRLANGQWRVNPSYSPPQVIRALGARLPEDRRWRALAASTARVLLDTAPKGFSPDWALYRAGRGFLPDPDTHAQSAYNAIRVYLWAGMLDRADPLAAPLLARFAPFADYIAAHGAPPETVDTTTGVAGPNDGNGGFSAAAVPFLDARGQRALADAQVQRVDALARQSAPGYYTSVLTLFGLGWRDGRFRFGADGSLDVRWEGRPCAAR